MSYHFSIERIVGLILFLVGIGIRRVAKKTLSRYYSFGLKTSQEHELIKHGFFKLIRHPIYLAMLIYSLAIPLIFSSLYGFLLMLGIIPCTLYRIRIEENMLMKRFGSEYLVYQKRTKKLLPFIY